MPDYLDWFVNRERQYQGFQKMLVAGAPKRVMLMQDGAGTGKSWLLLKMRHLCLESRVPVMYVDFSDRRSHDFLSLVRIGRDQLSDHADTGSFNALNATINQLTSVSVTIAGMGAGGGVSIADVQDATVTVAGDVAGGSIIKDNHFYVQGSSEVARRAAEIGISDAFFAALQPLLARGPLVFLFDTLDKITPEAERWLLDFLLPRIGEDDLPNAIAILAGRTVPEVSNVLQSLTWRTALPPLEEAHVKEYIEVRQRLTGLDIKTIFLTFDGTPLDLARFAERIKLKSQKLSDDDWLNPP